AETRADPERTQRVDLLRGNRLPDPQRQCPHRLELLPEAQGAEPPVLLVDGRDPARGGEFQAAPHRLDIRFVGDGQIALSKAPGSLLAQDPGRLAGGVAPDDATFDPDLPAGQFEPR